MATLRDARYIKLVELLIAVRKEVRVTQAELAKSLGMDQSAISKAESFDRRLDIIELHDWLAALKYDPQKFLIQAGLLGLSINTSLPALPVPGKAVAMTDPQPGTRIEMAWQGQPRFVEIAHLPVEGYLDLEQQITAIYRALNAPTVNSSKNREAIAQALSLAIHSFPEVNPSDLYHHVVYRLYLREYTKTQADRSWVRAGGEALEQFLQEHYKEILGKSGIELRWLSNSALRAAALKDMGIENDVGGSKLDMGLYGTDQHGEPVIFGGLHVKASLAERVSDDVPCSMKMMERGYVSYLLTMDAKSFPPPNGDLVNRGELGSPETPSDKRNYIEVHGSFTACFSYNLRTVPSGVETPSGRSIYVSSFGPDDSFPGEVLAAWQAFSARQRP